MLSHYYKSITVDIFCSQWDITPQVLIFNPVRWYYYSHIPAYLLHHMDNEVKFLFFMDSNYLIHFRFDDDEPFRSYLFRFSVARNLFFTRRPHKKRGREAIVITYRTIHRIRSFQRLWKNRRQRFRTRLISHRLNNPSQLKRILFDNIPLFNHFLTFRYGGGLGRL